MIDSSLVSSTKKYLSHVKLRPIKMYECKIKVFQFFDVTDYLFFLVLPTYLGLQSITL